MYRLLYISQRCRRGEADAEADAILAASSRNNMRLGLTGALFLSDSNFVQALEGDRPSVESVFARIRADPRHVNVTLLCEGEVRRRWFGNWSMARVDLDRRGLPGNDRAFAQMEEDDVLALLSSLALGGVHASATDAVLVAQLEKVRGSIASHRHVQR